jgi:hypothetical protein
MIYDSTIRMSERYSFFALARHAVNRKRPWRARCTARS